MTELFPIPWNDGSGSAIAIHVQAEKDLPLALQQLQLYTPRPTLALVGGATQMMDIQQETLKGFFTTVLGQTAANMGAAIVDGGTNTGIMQLMGQVRHELQASFPLIGVAPLAKLALPHRNPIAPEAAQPAPYHSHFILVPGQQWGDESAWLAQVTTQLAGNCRSVTIVVNGGEVTWKDVVESVAARRLTLIVAGSGRTADQLVKAIQGQSDHNLANQLVASGLLRLIHLETNLSQLATDLGDLLTEPG